MMKAQLANLPNGTIFRFIGGREWWIVRTQGETFTHLNSDTVHSINGFPEQVMLHHDHSSRTFAISCCAK